MNRIMLDLETMGTAADAAVLSLGACFFDEEFVGDSIYLVLDREEQILKGRTVTASTMSWWDQQSTEARAVWDAPQTPVKNALNCFRQWIEQFAPTPDAVEMWGYGSDFDCAIVTHLYGMWDIPRPWGYNKSRCFRTLKELVTPFGIHDMPVREGTQHNALDDAIYQAALAGRYLKGVLK